MCELCIAIFFHPDLMCELCFANYACVMRLCMCELCIAIFFHSIYEVIIKLVCMLIEVTFPCQYIYFHIFVVMCGKKIEFLCFYLEVICIFFPGASILLAELAMEAGLPNGVLNIVHGTNVCSLLQ